MSVPHSSRRRLLQAGGGLAGLALAGTAAPAAAAAPARDSGSAADARPAAAAHGKHPAPGGVGDFRAYGITDAGRPADDALDAMMADPAVQRIEARSDLLFTRRHTFHRSGITLDFRGHRVRTTGIERNSADNPFGAVLYFRGTATRTVHRHTLTAEHPELGDVFEVGDSAKFRVGQWWAVESDARPGGKYRKELQRLVQVTEIVDRRRVRVGYQAGWKLAAGRSLSWTRIEPVERAHVRDMVFEGAGDDEFTGSHPVAYEYAIDCDVSGIDATGTFWPAVMRRWCTRYRTERCSLANPKSVTHGGAGYLTQQIYCLYGHVSDCTTSNARHLNDLTASAYCTVDNCHGDGDDQGPFVTHGQYEHDLTYTGNSGLMTFANSGAAWGSSAKRITVRKHVCSWFVARVAVTDLTLEDVHVVGKASLDGSGALWVNADGVQLRGCTATGPLVVTQASARSTRPNTLADCDFGFGGKPGDAGAVITRPEVTSPVTLLRCTLRGLDGAAFAGTGPLTLDHCRLHAADGAAPTTVASADLRVEGGEVRGAGLRLNGSADQSAALSGVRLHGGGKALLSRTGGARTVSWLLDGVDATATGSTAHVLLTAGANRYRATGATLTGGRLELRQAAFSGSGSHLLHTGCVEDGVTRTAMPKEGPRAAHTAGNLLLGPDGDAPKGARR